MLDKSKISKIEILSEEWHKARLAKFTSSEIHNLIGSGFLKYVRMKVGEEMTGKSCKTEVNNESVWHGNLYELEALKEFKKAGGIDFEFIQFLVYDENSLFCCTPDAMIAIRESPDGSQYEVEPVEVKCPPTYDNYIALYECESPQDLKKTDSKYYWQVIDQMDNCGSLVGHFVAYHPDFKKGNMRHIRFDINASFINAKGAREFPVFDDLKLLRTKKKEAEIKFNELLKKLNDG
jgi:hypothetical protein